MLERERQRLILRTAEERSVVSVLDLCELLCASEATIRRDLVAMADRGEIRRVRGGVEALLPRYQPHLVGTPLVLSLDVQVAQKRAIAREAALLIQPGESIIIGGGSTTFCMAEFLERTELDILTNSFPLVAHLVGKSRNRVTVPGGTVYREQSIVLSPFDDVSRNFCGRTLFIGCYGLNRAGLTENDPLIVQAHNKLLGSAERVVVLADSRKLRQHSAMISIPLSRVGVIITDSEATQAELDPFRAAGITTIQAEPEEAACVA